MFEFDIVTSEAFPDFINELVVPYVSSVARAVAKHPLRYTGEDWTPPEDEMRGALSLHRRSRAAAFIFVARLSKSSGSIWL